MQIIVRRQVTRPEGCTLGVKRIAPHVNVGDALVMPDYRRAWHPGGTCFLTANLKERHGNDLLTRHIDLFLKD